MHVSPPAKIAGNIEATSFYAEESVDPKVERFNLDNALAEALGVDRMRLLALMDSA